MSIFVRAMRLVGWFLEPPLRTGRGTEGRHPEGGTRVRKASVYSRLGPLVLAIVAVGVLAGVASSSGTQNKVTLVYLDDIYTDEASKKAQMEMIAIFEKRNPNIDIEYVAKWDTKAAPQEINFRPSRVLLQDFTGVPCVVDLAAMRDALSLIEARASGARPRLDR